MWSKVIYTTIGQNMVREIIANTSKLGLKYHNIRHVNSIYDFFEEQKVPYSEALDWAVLGHDYVFDADPFKEERSALALYYILFNAGKDEKLINESVSLVLVTKDHLLKTGSVNELAIIKGDLHELTVPDARVDNYVSILVECANLYNIPIKEIQAKNYDFMGGLYNRMRTNIESLDSSDRDNKAFFMAINIGIADTRSRKDKPL